MAVIHDAYLIDIEDFAKRIRQRDGESAAESYQRLRNEALAAFRRSSIVRDLADRYGGWDEHSLMTALADEVNEEPEHSSVWLMLLLYDSMSIPQPLPNLGLKGAWREAESLLAGSAWTAADIRAAIDGHTLLALFPERDALDLVSPSGGWNIRLAVGLMRPPSTASSVGWLSWNDVEAYQWRLERLSSTVPGLDKALLGTLHEMMSVATQHGAGLCLIKSG